MTWPAPWFEIRVQGHLDGHWAGWFAGLTLHHHADGTSTLVGPLTDQAQLHGVLARVRDLGAPLVSVTPVPDPIRSPGSRRPTPEDPVV